MPTAQESRLHLEIAHILFLDVVGYSKLLVNEQREIQQQLTQLVRESEHFRAAETAGKLIRLPVPELSEERRRDLVKSLKQMAEEARVRVRANRRSAMDEAKKMQKAGEATEDQLRDMEEEIQKLTDRFVKSIDEHFERKEAEVMKV